MDSDLTTFLFNHIGIIQSRMVYRLSYTFERYSREDHHFVIRIRTLLQVAR